jgi:hypothetical protein
LAQGGEFFGLSELLFEARAVGFLVYHELVGGLAVDFDARHAEFGRDGFAVFADEVDVL